MTSYIFDYIIIVVLIIVFSALDKAEPFHQRFSIHNQSLQYPFAQPERIAPWLAAIISVAFPAVVIILWTMVIDGLFSHHKKGPAHRGYSRRGVYTMQERLWEMNAGILGLGLSVAALITIIGALKNLTGKPRPDVLDRCKVDPTWIEPKVGLTGWEHCTGDPVAIRDGFKSWPSGHSGIAFGGLAYLSIYLAGKLHISDNRGEVWKTVIVLIPLLAASMVSISRIMDARHHPFDVLSSAILGIFVAWVAYRQYFPSLSKPWKKGRAYPIRSWGRDPPHPAEVPTVGILSTHHDEEEGKAGYIGRGSALGMPEDGSIIDAQGQRRRPNQSQSTIPSGPADPIPQPTAYHQTPSHDLDYEDADAFEMSNRKGPYSSTMGRGTQSTTDSHESDDYRRGIAAATSAVGGQTLSSTPIHEEFVGKKTGYGAQRVEDGEDVSR